MARMNSGERTALISVSEREGLLLFAAELVEGLDYRLLATGGTATYLEENGFSATRVSEHTGYPELMAGRVKTLHPKIHGGILCRRSSREDVKEAEEGDISLIDLVVVNLYPFQKTLAAPGTGEEEAIEQIDIGGPALLRSAAKNFASVTAVCDPADYPRVLRGLHGKADLAALRRVLAGKVFRLTAAYDAAIAAFLERGGEGEGEKTGANFPRMRWLPLKKARPLRYGENPHQKAVLFGNFFTFFDQLQGKKLSYNNILDITAAVRLMGEFERPTAAILKHGNPCGVAGGADLRQAWEDALATDREAPFGGIFAVNRKVDLEVAEKMGEIWCEVIIAPDFSEEAKRFFRKRKHLRLMAWKGEREGDSPEEVRSVVGGVLLQERDGKTIDPSTFRVATKRVPSPEEWDALLFGWRVVKHVKSNAVVYVRGERTLGIGAGQMSRVDSSGIAVWKASRAGLSLEGSAMASDGLIPFQDGLLVAAEAGARACIQPGGSIRDAEVVAAAEERGMAMVFTGSRHFRH